MNEPNKRLLLMFVWLLNACVTFAALWWYLGIGAAILGACMWWCGAGFIVNGAKHHEAVRSSVKVTMR